MKITTIFDREIDNKSINLVFTTKEMLKEVLAKYTNNIANLQSIVQEFEFKADFKQILDIKGIYGKQFILIGLGSTKELHKSPLNIAGGVASSVVAKQTEITVEVFVDADNIKNQDFANEIVLGILIKSYGFDKLITDAKHHTTHKINTINIIGAVLDINYIHSVVDGVNMAKDLINNPANIAFPKAIVEEIKHLSSLGVKITILDRVELAKRKMNLFLSVSDGSDKDPYVVVMEYNNNAEQAKPLAIVGKGVTFDSGGYSLKPPSGMMDMKKDMSGAAAAIGLMKVLATRKAKINVVAIVGLVENLVNGNATKPGDVVKAMNGKTVEILNTDAEGRLVLADLLHMCATQYQPCEMINLATLTGAIIVALGSERAGLFSNNKELTDKLISAADETGELLWHMPMGKEYEKHLKSSIADLQNISTAPKVAGSVFAAMFLKEFVNDVPWAHLDIAGVADITSSGELHQKGAKAFGVRLLDYFIKKHYENK